VTVHEQVRFEGVAPSMKSGSKDLEARKNKREARKRGGRKGEERTQKRK